VKRLLAALVFAAACGAQGARRLEIDPAKPNEVIATLNGAPVTAAEYQELLVAMDPKMRESVMNDGAETLRLIGWLRAMAAEAGRRGLTVQEPLRTTLEMTRMQLLSNAITQHREIESVVTPFEQQAYYNANLKQYSGVFLKVIYLPFTNETEELQAKRRIEEVHGKLKAGAPFVEMVKQYSKHDASREKNGDFDEIRMSDELPQLVKETAFSLGDQQYSAPVRLPNGYYIFQRTKLNVDPYAKVKDSIFTDMKQRRNLEWVNKQRAAVQVEVINPNATAPNIVVGKINGKPVQAAQVQTYLAAMDGKLREGLKNDLRELLLGIGFMQQMSELALAEKLDQRAPYKQQLELILAQAKANAVMAAAQAELKLTEAEIRKGYDDNLNFYSSARVKLIYLPAAEEDKKSVEAAMKLGGEIHAKLKGGLDFVAAVKEYSKDPVTRNKNGDYPPLKITDEFPREAKASIWALKPGEFGHPTALPNGVYIYKLMGWDPQPYTAVKADVEKRLKQQRNSQWLARMRAGVDVKILDRK